MPIYHGLKFYLSFNCMGSSTKLEFNRFTKYGFWKRCMVQQQLWMVFIV